MNFKSLFDNDIYAIPAGDIWGKSADTLYIIYSPLSGHILIANHHELLKLEETSAGNTPGTDAHLALLKQLRESRDNQHVFHIPDTYQDIYGIDILLNFKCNFKCSYCYSASGRSSKEIDFEHVQILMDHLFSRTVPQHAPYKINFSGGGEPFLSFPLMQKTVAYIEEKAKANPLRYSCGVVTNGSLITDEIITFIMEHHIDLVISFEILQRFQDAERGSYDSEVRSMDMLIARRCPFGIRATITPLSVHHMTEMAQELSARFPLLDGIVFDPVLSADLFKTPLELDDYYNHFITEYWAAKEYAAELGIDVGCTATDLSGMRRTRRCQGKIVITPDGAISSCARVSSQKDTLYEKFTFGSVINGKVEIDHDKLSCIMQQNNIYTRDDCRQCYARWNCGGNCWLFSQSFPAEFETPYCNFTREALKRNLYDIICKRHNQKHQQPFWNFINQQL